jgi:hypothetical protein
MRQKSTIVFVFLSQKNIAVVQKSYTRPLAIPPSHNCKQNLRAQQPKLARAVSHACRALRKKREPRRTFLVEPKQHRYRHLKDKPQRYKQASPTASPLVTIFPAGFCHININSWALGHASKKKRRSGFLLELPSKNHELPQPLYPATPSGGAPFSISHPDVG